MVTTTKTAVLKNDHVPAKEVLTVPDHLSYAYRLPERLVRKKSGDVVKLLLKLSLLARLMLLPHLARKLVKFADRLTNVRMFDGADSPKMVSTPLELPVGEFDVDWQDPDYFSAAVAAAARRPFAGFDLRSELESDEETSGYEIVFTNMPRPHQYFYQQMGTTELPPKVQMHLIQTHEDYLTGLIDVANEAYEKFVLITMTVDGWNLAVTFELTLPIIQYNKLVSADRDQFRFKINVDQLSRGKLPVMFEICCKYCVAGHVYWDNNNSKNYQVTLKRTQANVQQHRPKLMPRLQSEVVTPKPRSQSTFSRYSFEEACTAPVAAPAAVAPTRPQLKSLFSLPDFTTIKHRYSKLYRDRGMLSVAPAPPFNSLSYTDILANFCFSNGSLSLGTVLPTTPPKKASPPGTPLGLSPPKNCSLPLTAATLHSLGDSIHI